MGTAADELLKLKQGPEATHQIVDSQTGTVIGSYSSLKRASHAADKKDLEYGAVRYVVRRIGN